MGSFGLGLVEVIYLALALGFTNFGDGMALSELSMSRYFFYV